MEQVIKLYEKEGEQKSKTFTPKISGIKGIFTAHGKSLEEIHKNKKISQLIENEIIEKIVILNVAKKGEYRCITL